jgi:hypothetical protein
MELTAQLPVLLGMLILAAMLALPTEQLGANRKVRDDHRRYQERMRRNHGEARRGRQARPKP